MIEKKKGKKKKLCAWQERIIKHDKIYKSECQSSLV